jgi:hypothetical protein
MINVDDEWRKFINNDNCPEESEIFEIENIPNTSITQTQYSKPTELYISTKSKIVFLNRLIDLDLFWLIKIIPYHQASAGVIKKQIKINSRSLDEIRNIEIKLKDIPQVEQQIISQIHNPTNRTKFKDIRKIYIGLCKKDILSYRCKKKQAFYNCFVIILRLQIQDSFKDFHIKIFNTGKIEIPGVQNEDTFNLILIAIIDLFQPHIQSKLEFKGNPQTILINSNFNCGYFINREEFFEIITKKYGIHAIYDPCSYPGVQCKFYHKENSKEQTGIIDSSNETTKGISFMVFRTGSVLIVGMCEEYVIREIYQFLKKLLTHEYIHIFQKNENIENKNKTYKTKKVRKKFIFISR